MTDRSLKFLPTLQTPNIAKCKTRFSKLEIRLKSKDIEKAPELLNSSKQLQSKIFSIPLVDLQCRFITSGRNGKMADFIIFLLFGLIAGINVISAVATIILDKKNEIAVLKTLGSQFTSIKRILCLQVGALCFIGYYSRSGFWRTSFLGYRKAEFLSTER